MQYYKNKNRIFRKKPKTNTQTLLFTVEVNALITTPY